ncbi:MAG: right-handed parallel beta-helix repeat-containing protein [Anaerolineales bacterium]|nr:right-handed parallel beta-helix repeat-containing protein [Anaerolineales bacterium]
MRKWLFMFVLAMFLVPQPIGFAQSLPPAEPDSEAFIEANFHLQDYYQSVRCVSAVGSCPSEVEVQVPCLTAQCEHPLMTYTIQDTYSTIQSAADEAQAGDLIIIMPGHYGGVQLEEVGGDEGAYIHFLGWGDAGTVVVDQSADPSKSWLRHWFYFIDAHHYIIQNLAFEGADDGAGIFVSGYFSETGHFSHHFVVMDVYSHDNGEWGLHSTATSYLLVQDSIFTHSGEEHGAYISGSGDHVLIRRNVFQSNELSGLQVNADPQTATMELFYWLQNSTGDTCGWSEEDADYGGSAGWQDIKACYDEQGLPDLGEFIEDGISEDLIIEQNVITDNGSGGAAGINLASVRNSVVRNNLIYGNGAAGIACWDNAYAEEKGLASSVYGCHAVDILNNTIVDEAGNRGALILNHDARDMRVYNNIIIRDRYDAYEVAVNSGSGLQSGYNYYFAQSIDESPGFRGDEQSLTGFSIPEALTHFVNPSFDLWVIEDGDWPNLNSTRPDYRLVTDSVLRQAGNAEVAPVLDLYGYPRAGAEIGAIAQ